MSLMLSLLSNTFGFQRGLAADDDVFTENAKSSGKALIRQPSWSPPDRTESEERALGRRSIEGSPFGTLPSRSPTPPSGPNDSCSVVVRSAPAVDAQCFFPPTACVFVAK